MKNGALITVYCLITQTPEAPTNQNDNSIDNDDNDYEENEKNKE